MPYQDLINSLQHLGKDPSRLIFEDELTGIYNRRFLHNYFEHQINWRDLNGRSLSLLMMDLDHFKQINDQYGHHSGDQALLFIAGLLKEVSADEGLSIRYAGDEFMILLPHGTKREALKLGERLLQRVHQEPLNLEEGQPPLHLTLSIGVASVPEDARTGKVLIQKADTALYYAKKCGRDRIANVGEIGLQEVFPKEAIYKLESANIAGRGAQLAQVADALKKFSQRQSQFLLVEGPAGMGKTMFLDTIRRNLAQSDSPLVKVNAIREEGYRPYYLATNILVGLLNQRPDKGAKAFESLTPKAHVALSKILPQLGGSTETQTVEDDTTQREAIFNALVRFIPMIVESRPLVVLVDDLQYADEATLVLLRLLMLRKDVPIFFCGTSLDLLQLGGEEQTVPLQQFYVDHHEELGIRPVVLKPLTAADIATHLQSIFPNVAVPPQFERELAQITQGNPLFLGEVLRKLVMDQKIILVDQRWVMQKVEETYLPRSLEEIVNEKISALDEESRQLLAQASTMGEDVSLSMLTGTSDTMEAKVLEFVDQAQAVGLLSSDFELNDETIRFLGKRVLEITYGGIRQDQKEALHERIGNYQETLFQRNLLPSASYLAYHFKRSANHEKAGRYEEIQTRSNRVVFNAEEAASYSGEPSDEEAPLETPLDQAGLTRVQALIRALQLAVRNFRLYPPESKMVIDANLQVQEALDAILATNEYVNISQDKKNLLANGQVLEVGEFKAIAVAFLTFLARMELQGLGFHRGVAAQEIKVLVETLGSIKPKDIDQRFWQRFSTEHSVAHVNLKQVRYKDQAKPKEAIQPVLAAEQKLDKEELAKINEIVRCLLGAARSIKLYPLKSNATAGAIEALMNALQSLFEKRAVLTLARVGTSVLANGERADLSEIKGLTEAFLEFLNTIKVGSLTFLRSISVQEVQTFIDALRELPTAQLSSEYWKRFGEEQGFSSLLFDERRYEVGVAATLTVEAQAVAPEWNGGEAIALMSGDGQAGWEGMTEAQWLEEAGKEPFDTFVEKVSGRLLEPLLRADTRHLQWMIRRLFFAFSDRDPVTREKIVDACRSSLKAIPIAFQPQFTKLVADPLLSAFSEEKDQKLLSEVATVLYRMATNLIQFAEYPLASRILIQLHSRQRQLDEAKDARAQVLLKVLDRQLEGATKKLLVEDFKSGDATRQQNAAQLLGSLGRVSLPLLVDIIKQEDELRVRQIAASLLAELGPKAVAVLKRELVLEIAPQERVRILEIIDSVTRALKTELAYALGEKNPDVRQAAFRLAERLNDKQTADLVLQYAANGDLALATSAIRCLGKLKPVGVSETLVSLMNSAREEDRILACCQAMGQVGDSTCIETLGKILSATRGWFSKKKWTPQVRAAAAFALGQIAHLRAAEVLALFSDDSDPRVRQIAQGCLKK